MELINVKMPFEACVIKHIEIEKIRKYGEKLEGKTIIRIYWDIRMFMIKYLMFEYTIY